MDASKPLLNTVRVPRKVVVHHQVGALQVDPLRGGVIGQEYLHIRVVQEGFLNGPSVLPPDTAMNHHYCLLTAQESGNPVV